MVSNQNGSGAGSLQQAIIDANGHAGLDTINFNVPGSGIQFLFTSAPLPTITDPVVIDGTTQPGYAGTPLIHMEGMGTGQAFNITAGGTTIKGLSFTSFFAGATNGIIKLSGPGNNVITGCAFGVRGDSTRPTTASIGVLIDGSNNNRVGGTTAAERNYFAIGSEQNLVIQNGASSNRVTGNWFGTGPNGNRMESFGRDAIRILNSPNNTIGGSVGTTPGGACTGECNVITAAGNNGVFISGATSSGNRVVGSFVGLFPNGTSVNDNNLGIRIENAPNTMVGGITAAERNVITGNSGLAGVLVTGAGSTGAVITGNYIGLYSNGTSTPPAANVALDGVLVNGRATNARIGGLTAGERNVISGLRNNGIEIAGADSNLVQGNYIGTDASGMVRSTTVSNGVGIFFANNNTVGGTVNTTLGGACTGACNVISGNGNNGIGDGVFLSTANGNTIDGNYIGLNAAGTGLILNGRTPDGSVFNGRAIRLLNSSSNTIGRQIPPMRPPNDIGSPAENIYCIQNEKGYVSIMRDLDFYTYEARSCLNGGTISGSVEARTFKDEIEFSTGPADPFYMRALVQQSTNAGIASFVTLGGNGSIRDSDSTQPRDCSCPELGHQVIAGTTELLEDNGDTNSNFLGGFLSGKTPLGTPFSELVLPESPVKISGDDNEVKNVDLFSTNHVDIDLNLGESNRWLEATLGHSFNLGAIYVAPGANGGIPPPTIQEVRITEEGVVRMTFMVTGAPPNSRVRVTLWTFSLRPGAEDLTDVIQTQLPVDVPLIITDGNGNGSATFVFQGVDADAIRDASLLLSAQATVFVSPMSPDSLRSSSALSVPVVVPRPANNYDRDNRTDLAVFRPGATADDPSNWYVQQSRDGAFLQAAFGSREDKVVVGDYNGDRTTDYSVWRPANGTWYIADPTGVPAQDFTAIQWGVSTDIPLAEDYDGDGRTDVAVFRPSQGAWYIRESSSGNPFVRQWGLAGDKPVPADYNGDGKAEVAVFRAGVWYISACVTCAVRYEYFGVASDVPVPADYDGDGRIDIAVWRPSTGIWYINGSTIGLTAYQWGSNGDKPLFGDYDGDGQTDISVFRPLDGNWYVRQSSNGSSFVRHFGQNGDLPTTSFEAKYHY
jgi:hypothetical protein